ncbi:MAG TPA: aromatic ring-hydroxylating dioxygenase subunit alpha [Candidatus Limnocylindrales bacterium]|nr:aromatic ring-hydroxylating dioxygenase subunit alpha [Candidatus Limnocylindrales bacterium]
MSEAFGTDLRSPLSAADVAATRQPVDRASLLPPRAFHDPEVFAFEQQAWFARTWLCVGREEDVPMPGTYVLVDIAGEGVIVVRDRDGSVRAFHNVCRHRGSTLLDPPVGDGPGRVVRIQCPYHAWIYGLDGALQRAPHTEELVDFAADDNGLVPVAVDAWQGFLFVNLDPDARPLLGYLNDLPAAVGSHPIGDLRRARRIEYHVDANWKVIGENYSECYHCPGVHPQLNRLSPYDRGMNLESAGPWAGGWMELIEEAATMSTDGGSHGRPPLRGITGDNARRVYYFVVWPNLLLSLHPDYVMTHQVWPVDAERSRVVCEWLFDPEQMALPDFDPSDAIDFWDLTNRQDWAVCERQQTGTRSNAYVPGRYSLMEDMVHAFDLMIADGYAQDGVVTRFEPRHDKWSTAPRRAARTG